MEVQDLVWELIQVYRILASSASKWGLQDPPSTGELAMLKQAFDDVKENHMQSGDHARQIVGHFSKDLSAGKSFTIPQLLRNIEYVLFAMKRMNPWIELPPDIAEEVWEQSPRGVYGTPPSGQRSTQPPPPPAYRSALPMQSRGHPKSEKRRLEWIGGE
jgi:hypothetical protein